MLLRLLIDEIRDDLLIGLFDAFHDLLGVYRVELPLLPRLGELLLLSCLHLCCLWWLSFSDWRVRRRLWSLILGRHWLLQDSFQF